MNEKGLVHIYCGDGKGKTTASIGLMIRALGSGMKVIFLQMLKKLTYKWAKDIRKSRRTNCVKREGRKVIHIFYDRRRKRIIKRYPQR